MEGDLIRNRIQKPDKRQNIEEEQDANFSIESGPFYSSLIINLKLHQSLLVEASQVTAMDSSIVFIANLQDGLLKHLTNFLGKEILFINQFSAEEKPGKIFLSPGLPGNIHHYYLTLKTGILLQSSCFIACIANLNEM
ncbi:MAG: AIM24 family protein [Snowella sp.]